MNLNKELESCVRPLVVETGLTDFPHSAWGSSFLVGLEHRSFLITTRHGMRPFGDVFPLCVRSLKGRLFETIDVFYMPVEDFADDHYDIAVIEISTKKLRGDLGGTPILPLDSGLQDWQNYKEISPFKILGFPRDYTYCDFESGEVVEGLVTLEAYYVGPASGQWIYQLAVPSPPPLSTFSGFSGGPVFLIARDVGIAPVPVFAGMALQGTIESGIVRFVERERVVEMIRARIAKPRNWARRIIGKSSAEMRPTR